MYGLKEKLEIDVLYEGETEATFPKVVDDVIKGSQSRMS